MTKREATAEFAELWADAVEQNPRLAGDKPAKREAWNNYTDALCKDGRITTRQYETW